MSGIGMQNAGQSMNNSVILEKQVPEIYADIVTCFDNHGLYT